MLLGSNELIRVYRKLVAKSNDGIEVTIEVILNYELEREILGFGDSITVLKPQRLKERIEKRR